MLKSSGALILRKTRRRVKPANEVHLRRLTVDEALIKLDRYLNDAYMAGLYQVRVIHGKGTGTLRQVVREELAHHPLVKSHRPGGYGEGGEGTTRSRACPKVIIEREGAFSYNSHTSRRGECSREV